MEKNKIVDICRCSVTHVDCRAWSCRMLEAASDHSTPPFPNNMSVRLVCWYCPAPPLFRGTSGKLLCSACNIEEEREAARAQQQQGSQQPPMSCTSHANECFDEARAAVHELAFVVRTDKRVHD